MEEEERQEATVATNTSSVMEDQPMEEEERQEATAATSSVMGDQPMEEEEGQEATAAASSVTEEQAMVEEERWEATATQAFSAISPRQPTQVTTPIPPPLTPIVAEEDPLDVEITRVPPLPKADTATRRSVTLASTETRPTATSAAGATPPASPEVGIGTERGATPSNVSIVGGTITVMAGRRIIPTL